MITDGPQDYHTRQCVEVGISSDDDTQSMDKDHACITKLRAKNAASAQKKAEDNLVREANIFRLW